jgi:hypothetical protein
VRRFSHCINQLGTIVSGNLNGLSAGGENILLSVAATSGASQTILLMQIQPLSTEQYFFGLFSQGTGTPSAWFLQE